MQFNQLTIIDTVHITSDSIKELKQYSKNPIKYFDTKYTSQEELRERIGISDAILISFDTTITKEILKNNTTLKYIGICGTNLKNVPVEYLKEKNIVLKNVYDYGDIGVAEQIFMELLLLFRGVEKYMWQSNHRELCGKTIGLIGVGAVGKEVIKVAKGFGMNILYTARSKKPELESQNIHFKNLDELIKESDIISLHVPKDLMIFGQKEFDLMTKNKIFINTCLGEVLDIHAFQNWINKKQNFAIFDGSAGLTYDSEIKNLPNMIYRKNIFGITDEAKERMSNKVLSNIQNYLKNE